MDAVLEARGVAKEYVEDGAVVNALRGADLSVSAGEFVAIMGPSGSGKTTLLNLLGLLDSPTSGTVHLEGDDVGSLDDEGRTARRRDRLGFVFQQSNLVPALTALENVAMPLVIARTDRSTRVERARQALVDVGLGDRADHLPSKLSGGERQRVAVARALIHRPAVVLADEPTGSLDSATGRSIVELLDRVRRERATGVVMVHPRPSDGRHRRPHSPHRRWPDRMMTQQRSE